MFTFLLRLYKCFISKKVSEGKSKTTNKLNCLIKLEGFFWKDGFSNKTKENKYH